MRLNEQEVLALLSTKTPDWEGQLTYKPPKSGGSFAIQTAFKERYFKIIGNLLFCLRVSSATSVFHTQGEKVSSGDVVSVMVLEHFTVQEESLGTQEVHAFSLIFNQEETSERKHVFVTDSHRSVVQWMEALRGASYEARREQLILLQIKLRNKTSVDPLRGTPLQFNPVYCCVDKDKAKAPPDFSRLCSIDRAISDPSLNVPKPHPRKQKKNGHSKSSNFVSHLGVENWETFHEDRSASPDSPEGINKSKPTFKSHVPEANLIQF